MSKMNYRKILEEIIGPDLSHWGCINDYVEYTHPKDVINTYWSIPVTDSSITVSIRDTSSEIIYSQMDEANSKTPPRHDFETFDMHDPESIDKLRAKIRAYVERVRVIDE